MIGRFLRSRGARKFKRNRLAMGALAVISLYCIVALVALVCDLGLRWTGDETEYEASPFGFLSIPRTSERVGPDSILGFGKEPHWEKRMQHSEFLLERIERALDEDDPAAALDETRFAELRPADLEIEVFEDGVDVGWELFDEADELADVMDEHLAELDALTAEDAPPVDDLEAESARLRAAAAEAEAAVIAKVEEIEAHVDALFPTPDGGAYWLRTLLGTDRQGRSILLRAVYSIKTAVQVGIVTALVSVILGSILGAAAAVYGGWVDHVVIWLYSTFSSVPNLVLLSVLSIMFAGTQVDGTMIPLYAAFCMTFWIGPCRVIRGEALKIKELEFVQAATVVGFGRFRILIKHVLPNTSHLIFVNFSLLFIAAIKSEVILTFLGLGLKDGASWGIMIHQSVAEVITGNFWQIGAATAFMFVLVLAFNVLTDALQDAFDPKHVS